MLTFPFQFKSSGTALNPLDNGDHSDRISSFFHFELGIPAHRVIIQFEQLDRANIGFCGTTKLEVDRGKEEKESARGVPLRKKSMGFYNE
jgi:hypothetical protein